MSEKFIVHPEYENIATHIKKALKNFSKTGEYVVRGERNDIKKITIESTVFNVKKFKTPNAFQSVIYRFFRKSKARRSYEYALKLIDSAIKTPFPVAYLERFQGGLRESFYISLHLEYDFDFRTLIHEPKFENRDEILRQFTQFTFQLHEHDIHFLDHSPGNTLIVKKESELYDFYLIDLNRMRFEKMDFNKRMRNFRRLWLSKTMISVMAKEYAQLYGIGEKQVLERMTHYSRAFQKSKNRKKLRRRKH